MKTMQKIKFVTGKGGVGKSIIAASLALREARKGQRVLLVELGEHSFYSDFFAAPGINFKPQALSENIDIAIWDGGHCLREYAQHLVKIQSLTDLFFDNPVMRTFLNAAPALAELAIVGKATSGHRKVGPMLPYDLIVIDTFATGHFLALLRAPLGMSEVVSFGPMGEQSKSIHRVLMNPELTSYTVVTLAEELSITESQELVDSLHHEFKIVPEIIVNKCVENQITQENLQKSALSSEWKAHLQQRVSGRELAQKKWPQAKLISQILNTDPWQIVDQLATQLRQA